MRCDECGKREWNSGLWTINDEGRTRRVCSKCYHFIIQNRLEQIVEEEKRSEETAKQKVRASQDAFLAKYHAWLESAKTNGGTTYQVTHLLDRHGIEKEYRISEFYGDDYSKSKRSIMADKAVIAKYGEQDLCITFAEDYSAYRQENETKVIYTSNVCFAEVTRNGHIKSIEYFEGPYEQEESE